MEFQPKDRTQVVSHAEHQWMLSNDMIEVIIHL